MNYAISTLSLELFFSFEYKRNKLSISATTKKIVKNLKLESIDLTKLPFIFILFNFPIPIIAFETTSAGIITSIVNITNVWLNALPIFIIV